MKSMSIRGVVLVLIPMLAIALIFASSSEFKVFAKPRLNEVAVTKITDKASPHFNEIAITKTADKASSIIFSLSPSP